MRAFLILFSLGFLSASFSRADALVEGRVCDVKQFGAKGDGKTKDTSAIQAAIDACAGSNGVVRLREGIFRSGMIQLKSEMKFVIEPTATLLGSQDDSDYPDRNPATDNTQLHNCRKALIYAEGAHHLVIEGGGTIHGNGNIKKWLGPSHLNPERTRPMAVFITLSSDILIQNIQVKDSAMWSVVNMEVDRLVLRNIQIHSDLSGNRDGIDIVDCHHVLIENATIFSEDDSICLKSGTARGTEDVVVRDSRVLQSRVANALKLGTASTGGFHDILFENIKIDGADKAAMAVESVDGAQISNIRFKDIEFHRVGGAFFVLLGKRGTIPKLGSIDGVYFENITGDQMKHSWGSPLSGTVVDGHTYEIRNLRFQNVNVTFQGGSRSVPPSPPEYLGQYPDPNLWGNLPAYGFYLRHVNGVTFEKTLFQSASQDSRKLRVLEDVKNFTDQSE